MNFLLIAFLTVSVASFLPQYAAADSSDKETDEPRALPLTAANVAANKQNIAGEIWQEDDHEILVRSERGAKNNGGASSGKETKQKRVNANSRKLAETKSNDRSEQKIEHSKHEHENNHKNRIAKKPCKFCLYFIIICRITFWFSIHSILTKSTFNLNIPFFHGMLVS